MPGFPKQHSWKTALHSFEHALVSYMCCQALHQEPVTVYLPGAETPRTDDPPYFYKGTVASVDMSHCRGAGGPVQKVHIHRYPLDRRDFACSDKPLAGKKVAVLVETEYIYDEIQYYKKHVEELGGELHLLSTFGGYRRRTSSTTSTAPTARSLVCIGLRLRNASRKWSPATTT